MIETVRRDPQRKEAPGHALSRSLEAQGRVCVCVALELQQLDKRLKIADRKASTGRMGAARRGLSDAAKQAAVVAATRHLKATD